MPDYNRLVWIYDLLTRLVFGNKLERAKAAKLENIEPGARVLVVGGGTGSILEYLGALNTFMVIDYVDISAKMINQAKQRQFEGINVRFFQQSILDFQGFNYDIIITDFFFDQFKQRQAQGMAENLAKRLSVNGLLLFSDFIPSSYWIDRVILRMMIWFLRITAALKIVQLPDYDQVFAKAGFSLVRQERARRNIQLAVYRLT